MLLYIIQKLHAILSLVNGVSANKSEDKWTSWKTYVWIWANDTSNIVYTIFVDAVRVCNNDVLEIVYKFISLPAQN